MSDSRPPQIFEEWWDVWGGATEKDDAPPSDWDHDNAEAAYAAGVASQQAEIERLNRSTVTCARDCAAKDREIERLTTEYANLMKVSGPALAVVEAARELQIALDEIETARRDKDPTARWLSACLRGGKLRDALAALEPIHSASESDSGD